MDQDDCYFNDMIDGINDSSSSSNDDDDGNGNNIDIDDKYKKEINQLKKHLKKETYDILIGNVNSNSNDNNYDVDEEFENEMYNESLNHINGVHLIINNNEIPSTSHRINQQRKSLTKLNYLKNDLINADNDDDELLYDPDEDKLNQQWINNRLMTNNDDNDNDNNKQLKKLNKNKTTLNCPCCLTLLSIDCQRHSIYKTQYRSMFVNNCRIDFNKKLYYKNEMEKKRQKQQQQQHINNIDDENDNKNYHPVYCKNCNTNVAVYDCNDEIYHFFSIIASH